MQALKYRSTFEFREDSVNDAKKLQVVAGGACGHGVH